MTSGASTDQCGREMLAPSSDPQRGAAASPKNSVTCRSYATAHNRGNFDCRVHGACIGSAGASKCGSLRRLPVQSLPSLNQCERLECSRYRKCQSLVRHLAVTSAGATRIEATCTPT